MPAIRQAVPGDRGCEVQRERRKRAAGSGWIERTMKPEKGGLMGWGWAAGMVLFVVVVGEWMGAVPGGTTRVPGRWGWRWCWQRLYHLRQKLVLAAGRRTDYCAHADEPGPPWRRWRGAGGPGGGGGAVQRVGDAVRIGTVRDPAPSPRRPAGHVERACAADARVERAGPRD